MPTRLRGIHPGKLTSLLSYGSEFYYTNYLMIRVRRICVVKFITVTQQENKFSRVRIYQGESSADRGSHGPQQEDQPAGRAPGLARGEQVLHPPRGQGFGLAVPRRARI